MSGSPDEAWCAAADGFVGICVVTAVLGLFPVDSAFALDLNRRVSHDIVSSFLSRISLARLSKRSFRTHAGTIHTEQRHDHDRNHHACEATKLAPPAHSVRKGV